MGRRCKKVKGWKTESHKTTLKDEVCFWRNKYRSGFIVINTVEKGAPARDKGKYQLQINTGQHLDTQYFNSIPKAIKFARDWMKKFPRG